MAYSELREDAAVVERTTRRRSVFPAVGRLAQLPPAGLLKICAYEVGLPEVAEFLWLWQHLVAHHPVDGAPADLQRQARFGDRHEFHSWLLG